MSVAIEQICKFSSALYSPVEVDDALYMIAMNGDIVKHQDDKVKTEFRFGGQPSGLVIEKESRTIYLADMAHQAIIMKSLEDNNAEAPADFVKDFEGMPLLGPNSLVLSVNMNAIFFTDSGPFCETSIENCKGSVYMIDVEASEIKPLALNCLAYPSGLVLSNDEKILYVCETCNNRVLRFVLFNQGMFYFSVYYQFTGRFGPTAVAVSQSDLLYVARFEFAQISDEGQISVLNAHGQLVENIAVPNYPEISGLSFSFQKQNVLYITDNSSEPCCLKIIVQSEDKDDVKNKKDKENTPFRQMMK